jgi:colanic acid biosynthesis glycosyl transferase WcaI
MKILIHGINYYPELTGIGKFTGEMAEWLSSRGHKVRVVTAPPYYPEWQIGKGYSAFRYRKEHLNEVEVFRCPLWIPRNVDGINRIIHLLSFALSSFWVLLYQAAWRPQVVLSIAPAFFSTPVSLMGSLLSGAKAWLHIQDFELDAAFNLGILRVSRLKKVVENTESWILKRFDRISTISHQMIKNLYRKGIKDPNTSLFPNWVDTEWIYPLEGPNPMRDELGISSGTIVALYSGSMGKKQGFEILAEAARNLEPHTKIKFIFCGEGSSCSSLKSMTSDLSNVIYLSLQPVEKLNNLLNLADVHLLPQRADAADLVMPSKLTGILASGKPVIATAKPNTEIAQAVKNRGIVVPPDNTVAFSKALLWLANHPEERTRLGQNGRIFAKEYLSKEKILSQFEMNLFALINDKKVKDRKAYRINRKNSYQPKDQYSTKHSI